jgi:hypothetical protein
LVSRRRSKRAYNGNIMGGRRRLARTNAEAVRSERGARSTTYFAWETNEPDATRDATAGKGFAGHMPKATGPDDRPLEPAVRG